MDLEKEKEKGKIEEMSGVEEGILEEIEEEEEVEEEEKREFVCFMLANEEYAVDIQEIREIIRLEVVTEVPRTLQFIKGVITLRGIIVTIIDLRERLGLEKINYTLQNRIIITSKNDSLAGLIVDQVTQVVRINPSSVEPPPPVMSAIEAEYIKGVTRIEGRLIILLNLQSVLNIKQQPE